MTTLIDNNKLTSLSFPDTEVVEFDLDTKSNLFNLRCKDGFLKEGDDGYSVDDVRFCVNDFTQLLIREYGREEKNWDQVMVYTEEYALKDVCEFIVTDEKITLRGFSQKRGFWTEFVVVGGNRKATYQAR